MQYIIGIDEVGRGAYAGELTICGLRAPPDWNMEGLKDSKKLSRIQRTYLSNKLHQLRDKNIIDFALISYSNEEIDTLGLAFCLKASYIRAVNQLHLEEDQVLLDGNLNPQRLVEMKEPKLKINPSLIQSVIKADTKFPSVMAASIVAKHYRDDLMINVFHKRYPNYCFDENVGYIAPRHLDGIRKFGLTNIHRKSYNVKL